MYVYMYIYIYIVELFVHQQESGYDEAKHEFDMIWVLKKCLTHCLNDDRAYAPHYIYVYRYTYLI